MTDPIEHDVERLDRELDSLLGDRGSSPSEFWERQFDLGLAWVDFAAGEGGLGLSPKLRNHVVARLAAAGAPLSVVENSVFVNIIAPTVAAFGSEEQRRLLRPGFSGREGWCQLFSEPGAGSDLAGLATRAVREGEEWIVDGQKVWSSFAHDASWGLLLARTDPEQPKHKGITCFVLDMDEPGVEVRPLRQLTGDAHFNEVFLDRARVPDSSRLGDVGRGWSVAMATLMGERVSYGGTMERMAAVAMQRAVDAAAGDPDADPMLRDEVVRRWIEHRVLQLTAARGAEARERGLPGPDGATLKLAGSVLTQRLTELVVDLQGSAGLLVGGYDAAEEGSRLDQSQREEPGIAWLRSTSFTIAGGTSEIMRNVIGERVLGLPREARADADVPWSQVPRN